DSTDHETCLFSFQACSLECDGELDGQGLRRCQDFLFEEENRTPVDADGRPEQELGAAMLGDDDPPTTPEHLLAKKYSGFPKRYGGFMSRRSSSLEGNPGDPGDRDQEENIRQEVLKILGAASEGGGPAGGVVKRYGGFMRRTDGEAAPGQLLEAVLGRGLRKRYGGFMRRVGRPEWLVDGRNGGALKRSWENGSELQKRYGGFMD
ncbi:proenkephalin-A-like, partial [Cololabis saira]|uniref:proenkephalin-A-like n=1 Tax=Cololabis saira TaxID=129043 RepID=UPI002AD4C536